ncbi:MAG: 4-hydroxy-tetrahydrodipicolinate synthase [Bacteroidaceae bacterium]|nr:4-hydroxy-tetrahydrodipicolinate synthase [Bacteroidaceae bacterium]
MGNNSFRGLGIALVTPFHQDGTIDYERLGQLVDFQIDGGIDFLCVLGTTAETPTLTGAEQQQVIDFVAGKVAGRVPILIGCSSNCTATAIDKLKNIRFTGASAILSAVPYYNKPSQEGIYQHFKAIAEASPLPIILYNIPGRTGVNMTVETTLRLANDFKNIIGIKEASGNVEQICEILRRRPEGFTVLSGDDSITLNLMKNGAEGVISVIGNALPSTFSSLIHFAEEKRYEMAQEIQTRLAPVYGLLFKEGNPCGIKALLNAKNRVENVLRLPMVPVSQSTYNEIEEAYKGLDI